MERTLKEIEKDLKKARKAYDKKWKEDNSNRSWDEFLEYARPEIERIGELDREKRMTMPYTLSDIPDYADVMSLAVFIKYVNDGCFIDYDGFGHYVLDGKETDVMVHPSDIEHGAIRLEFDSVAWYNR